jgi:hypothetical protein
MDSYWLVLLVRESVDVEAHVCMMCCGVVATTWARGVAGARMLDVASSATHDFVLDVATITYRQSTERPLRAPVVEKEDVVAVGHAGV